MPGCDADVTAREIFDDNDKREGWSKHNPRWARVVDEFRTIFGVDLLAFNAQTTIAGSYGLMQMLYATAIAPMNWQQAQSHAGTAEVNPSYLFDTNANLAAGNGSVPLGTAYMRRCFAEANTPKKGALPRTFASRQAFYSAYALALRRYNLESTYRSEVMRNFNSFAPVQPGSLVR